MRLSLWFLLLMISTSDPNVSWIASIQWVWIKFGATVLSLFTVVARNRNFNTFETLPWSFADPLPRVGGVTSDMSSDALGFPA